MTPLISVITPVGPYHTRHAAVAHASTQWQTIPTEWIEHICVFDHTRKGPAVARNAGIAAARGIFAVCLDADDYLLPTALETYIRHYAQTSRAYVYGDNYVLDHDGGYNLSSSYEYRQRDLASYNVHVVTAMAPLTMFREIGGFDEGVGAWEDWTPWIRAAIKGYCGDRIPSPCLVYRIDQGKRMQNFLADPVANLERMRLVTSRYANKEGWIDMAGCCGGFKAEHMMASEMVAQLLPAEVEGGIVRLQYVGNQEGGYRVNGPSGTSYKGGKGRLVDIPIDRMDDVAYLEAFRDGAGDPIWRRVPQAAPFVPPPILDLSDPDARFADLAPGAIVLEV